MDLSKVCGFAYRSIIEPFSVAKVEFSAIHDKLKKHTQDIEEESFSFNDVELDPNIYDFSVEKLKDDLLYRVCIAFLMMVAITALIVLLIALVI